MADQAFKEALADLANQVKNSRLSKRFRKSLFEGYYLSRARATESAYKTLERLSKSVPNSLFEVHALTAFRDSAFWVEKASESYSFYKKALKSLGKLKNSTDSYESLRLQYRLAWAAYRSANLSQTIEAGIFLLQPADYSLSTSLQNSIKNDACDLYSRCFI